MPKPPPPRRVEIAIRVRPMDIDRTIEAIHRAFPGVVEVHNPTIARQNPAGPSLDAHDAPTPPTTELDG